MTLQTWWLFVLGAFLISGTPGPNALHVMTRSIEVGLRRSTATMLGCLVALSLALSLSALGLTTLLGAVPGAFDVLRYVGVAYLLYLGIRTWRSDVASEDEGENSPPRGISLSRMFLGGFTITLSNPKLLLFASAFLPQFIDPSAARAPQFTVLIVTFVVIEGAWYLAYATGGRSLSRYLAKPSLKRAFNRVTGGIFVGFGLLLLQARPTT